MVPVLQGYLDVYRRFPPDRPLHKMQRRERHTALTEWMRRCYPDGADIGEIASFCREHSELNFGRPFYIKVLAPCVQKDIDGGRIEAVRFLFEFNRCDDFLLGTDRDPVCIFCDGVKWKYRPFQLADMVLEKEPGNMAVLRYKYVRLRKYINYTVHEVPGAVLDGIDGAEVSAIPGMLDRLQEFREIGQKLGHDDEDMITVWDGLYRSWREYLTHREEYADFAGYLDANQIPYDRQRMTAVYYYKRKRTHT